MTPTQATLGEIPQKLPYISINFDVPPQWLPLIIFPCHIMAVQQGSHGKPTQPAQTAALKGDKIDRGGCHLCIPGTINSSTHRIRVGYIYHYLPTFPHKNPPNVGTWNPNDSWPLFWLEKSLILEGYRLNIEDKQVPATYFTQQTCTFC